MDRRVKRERRGGLRGVGEGAGYPLAHPHVGRVALGGRGVGAQLHRVAAYGDMVARGAALVHAYYRHLAEDYVLFGLAYAARVVDARVADGLRPPEDVFDLGLVVRYRHGYEAVRIVVVAGRLRAVVVVVDDGRKPVSVHVVGRPPALVGRVGVVYLQLCSVSADGVDVGSCSGCRYVDERYSHVVAAGALAVALGEGKHVGAAAVGVGRRLYRVRRAHDYARACPLQRGAFDGGDRRVCAGYLSGDAADGDVGACLGGRDLAEVVDCGGRAVAFCIHKVPCIGYASVVAREYPRVVHYVGRVLYRRVAVVGDALGRCGCPVAVHAVRNCRAVELDHKAAGFAAYYCRYRSFLPHQRYCLGYRAAAVAPCVEAFAPAAYGYYVVLYVVSAVEGAERYRCRVAGQCCHPRVADVVRVGADDVREDAAQRRVAKLLVAPMSDSGVGYVVRVARAQDVRVVVGERSGAERAVACIVACHADAAAAVRVPYGECVVECAGPAEAVGAAALVVVGP